MKNNTQIIPIPEEDDWSDTDKIDIGQSINYAMWCVALFISIGLGIGCLISYPEIMQTHVLLYYIAFAMTIEIISVLIGGLMMSVWCVLQNGEEEHHMWNDAVGIFSCCTVSTSNIGHMITMPIGFYLLFTYPNQPLPVQAFVSFQILIGIVLIGKVVGTLWMRRRDQLGEYLELEFSRIRDEIREVRGGSIDFNSENSLRNSYDGREDRSTSFKSGHEFGDEPRSRAISTDSQKVRLPSITKAGSPSRKLQVAKQFDI